MKKETACVHGGTRRDRATGGINTPIYTSSACEYLDREKAPYPRYFNTVNQQAVVDKVCGLEGAQDGVLFSSGMAAMSTSILAFAGTGDNVVLMDELYGGTHAFAANDFARLGITHTFAPTNADAVIGAAGERTRVIVVESPTNPLLSVIDIAKVARFARGRGITTIIDSTFASPVNQNPIALGIDVVVHSGTKYLGGHSDLSCGLACASGENAARIRSLAKHLGGNLDTFACYLLERSIKTLALRVERQSANAMALALYLDAHPSVRRVNYPGLPGFPGHDIARTQMSGFGGMLSFYLDEGRVDPDRFVRRLGLIVPAVSLGGVDTTVCSPAATSHSTISEEDRARLGITPSLIRLSAGIEHVDDLVADLGQALEG